LFDWISSFTASKVARSRASDDFLKDRRAFPAIVVEPKILISGEFAICNLCRVNSIGPATDSRSGRRGREIAIGKCSLKLKLSYFAASIEEKEEDILN
jgi:hypothetical protein